MHNMHNVHARTCTHIVTYTCTIHEHAHDEHAHVYIVKVHIIHDMHKIMYAHVRLAMSLTCVHTCAMHCSHTIHSYIHTQGGLHKGGEGDSCPPNQDLRGASPP